MNDFQSEINKMFMSYVICKTNKIYSMKYTSFIFLLFVSVLIFSCSKDEVSESTPPEEEEEEVCITENVSYASFVKGTLSASCALAGCHIGSSPQAGLNLTSYNVVKSIADSGDLYGVISHASGFPAMPNNRAKLDQCIIDKIKSWIDKGAPNN